MDEPKKIINVVAAIIVKDGRLFATQRGYGEWKDWWEFPGGKIEGTFVHDDDNPSTLRPFDRAQDRLHAQDKVSHAQAVARAHHRPSASVVPGCGKEEDREADMRGIKNG